MLSVMKVTTQRTSKGPKLLVAVGILGVLVGVFGLMTSADWSLMVLLGGSVLWALGRVEGWFLNG